MSACRSRGVPRLGVGARAHWLHIRSQRSGRRRGSWGDTRSRSGASGGLQRAVRETTSHGHPRPHLRLRFVDKPTPPRPPRPPRPRPLPRPPPRLRGAPGRSDGPRRPRPPSRRRRGAPIARRYHRRAAPRDVSAGDAARLFTASRILDVCRSCVQLPRESAPLHLTCLPARGRLRGLAAMRARCDKWGTSLDKLPMLDTLVGG